MNTKDLSLSQTEIHKLLSAGSGDAALLHLYLQCGNPPQEAEASLGMSQARYSCAAATLRQLGLWPEESTYLRPAQQPPQYTEEDVTQAMNRSEEFRLLVGEVQRTLGRILTTEELNPPVLPELLRFACRGGKHVGVLLQRAAASQGFQPESLSANH